MIHALINLREFSQNWMMESKLDDGIPRLRLLAMRGAIKNAGALRECASIKPKYLPIRARHGRFFG